MYDVYNLVFHVNVCQFLGRIESELSEIRGKWRKSRKFPWKRHSVNPNLFDSVTLSPDRNNWTPTRNNSTCSITYTEKVENSHLPYHPKNKRRPPWQLLSKWNVSGDHARSCLSLRHKIHITILHAGDSAWVVSPLSAWDLDLVQEPLQPTLAAGMMPKKTKLQALHISVDA